MYCRSVVLANHSTLRDHHRQFYYRRVLLTTNPFSASRRVSKRIYKFVILPPQFSPVLALSYLCIRYLVSEAEGRGLTLPSLLGDGRAPFDVERISEEFDRRRTREWLTRRRRTDDGRDGIDGDGRGRSSRSARFCQLTIARRSVGRHVTMYEFIRVCPTDRIAHTRNAGRTRTDPARESRVVESSSTFERGIWTRSARSISTVETARGYACWLPYMISAQIGLIAYMWRVSKEGGKEERVPDSSCVDIIVTFCCFYAHFWKDFAPCICVQFFKTRMFFVALNTMDIS